MGDVYRCGTRRAQAKAMPPFEGLIRHRQSRGCRKFRFSVAGFGPKVSRMSLWQQANPQLQDLVSYEPGKPVEDLARELGIPPGDIIKLASNENPLGPSPKALAAMREILDRANFYPDGGGYYLREAIAEKVGVKRENVILGNGSNEIIEFIGHAFLQPGDEIITSEHAFAVYVLMAKLFGADTREIPELPGMMQDLDAMLAAISPRTRQVYITSPNNPTGTVVSAEEIDAFMARVPERVTVVFDEAYYEFLDNPDTMRYVREGRNVIILRTFSKIQGLANLRIGYGIAPVEMIEILQKTRQPFNANGIAQAGALAGLADLEHQTRTKAVTDEGRAMYQEAFAEMGLEYIPSHANFILVNVGDGRTVFEQLLKRGIIVRAMNGYKLPAWVRISIGTADQNRRCLEALREVMETKANHSRAEVLATV